MQARPTGLNKNREVVTVALRSRIDSELIAAAANGSESAFENLMVRYRPRMFALALRYTRIAEDAEDVVQQTFQKVFLNLSRFQGKSSFSTWLTRIAINESLMFLRRARSLREIPIDDMRETTSQELELLDSAPNPEITYLQRETAQQLFSAIAQLTPRLRMAIELRELRELSGPDTAQHAGVSVAAIKARVFHGRRKLREIIMRSSIVRQVAASGNARHPQLRRYIHASKKSL